MEDGKAVALDGYDHTVTSATSSPAAPRSRHSRSRSATTPTTVPSAPPTGQNGYLYVSTLEYDETADTMTDTTTGMVYTDNGNGRLHVRGRRGAAAGLAGRRRLRQLRRARSPTSRSAVRSSPCSIWTFVFAVLSVASTFALGLLLAIVFNTRACGAATVYRIMLILPYAFPAFLSALVWAGMMNQSFGFINQVLLGGADDPVADRPVARQGLRPHRQPVAGLPRTCSWSARARCRRSPKTSRGRDDGRREAWQIFRLIKFPLLLVTVAPLLIASFAFNFNNFNLIYMLTNGGPRFSDVSIPVGHTDILITMVYKVAFDRAGRDYGLAIAFSILIFIVVAIISVIAFRQTKALEELN